LPPSYHDAASRGIDTFDPTLFEFGEADLDQFNLGATGNPPSNILQERFASTPDPSLIFFPIVGVGVRRMHRAVRGIERDENYHRERGATRTAG
jgi:hypothetical protein